MSFPLIVTITFHFVTPAVFISYRNYFTASWLHYIFCLYLLTWLCLSFTEYWTLWVSIFTERKIELFVTKGSFMNSESEIYTESYTVRLSPLRLHLKKKKHTHNRAQKGPHPHFMTLSQHSVLKLQCCFLWITSFVPLLDSLASVTSKARNCSCTCQMHSSHKFTKTLNLGK